MAMALMIALTAYWSLPAASIEYKPIDWLEEPAWNPLRNIFTRKLDAVVVWIFELDSWTDPPDSDWVPPDTRLMKDVVRKPLDPAKRDRITVGLKLGILIVSTVVLTTLFEYAKLPKLEDLIKKKPPERTEDSSDDRPGFF